MKMKNVKGPDGLQEARRRARVLDRYNSIERPTAEDDEAAAAELGLSVGRTTRLAASWRRFRKETLLVGQIAALASEGRAPRDAIMAETIDLDGVRPDRRVEILRRIRIMQEHISAIERGEEDTVGAAERIGISKVRFQDLLRTWMLHAKAETLAGATRRGTPWRRQPHRARRQALLRSALDDADPGKNLRTVYEAFSAACIREDLTPLSLQRFYAIVHDLRDTGGSHDEAAREGDAASPEPS